MRRRRRTDGTASLSTSRRRLRWRASSDVRRGRRRDPARPGTALSRTPGEIQRPPAHPGQHTDEALADWGMPAERIAALRDDGAVA
ncbi:MAG: hypothetical protein R2690_18375 [Acidimicrobiales bacterium]